MKQQRRWPAPPRQSRPFQSTGWSPQPGLSFPRNDIVELYVTKGSDNRLLDETKSFWNANPCDGHDSAESRMRFKYAKEAWMPKVLMDVARHASILEVGCGQGSDALFICQNMSPGGVYQGIDYSDISVAKAKQAAAELDATLRVKPVFEVGNAEALPFPDQSFDCVFSSGVLHHTPGTLQAIDEVHRVLRPGGTAYVALYRVWSPKVLAAHALRLGVAVIDQVKGEPGWALKKARALNCERIFGTMFLEGIGVPVLKSYTRGQMRQMFSSFASVSVRGVGLGFGLFGLNRIIDATHDNRLGQMWLAQAQKSGPAR